ncbi:Dihydrodipicolinate synthase/N-acetylneuraminate lyase [Chelatococcus sambhunathii]|uniref:Dihydrodipicolinate synthase/N-acetylneuraminate lyase n=1 Tax=Chelatococcus sambhunathii TaxID=363953 RepID=A0ABM9U2T8_9HYPH|nr:dihydrodipicolinate synthase family protein [Chelatococcus sambhunathii]CUA87052.1 Dihydrodipicolinate synthase/N-acetylneuraminate lyase [Chelatococcus sambhunathii]
MLRGILPVLPTPFRPDGAIDEAAMRRLVAFALRSGVDGVVFPGFASEVESLSGEERRRLLAVVVDAVAGHVPVVAGASAASLEETIAHCRDALAAGVGSVMIQAPRGIGADREAVTAFFRGVAEAVPGPEIVLQNAPAPRGSDLDPRTILAVVRDVPAVRWVKEETLPSGPAITAILAEAPAHLAGVIGGGGARYILDEYARGACGAMPALELADLHVALDRAWQAGDRARARALYMRSLPLLALQALYRMRLTKHVLRRRGVLHNAEVRAPTPELDPWSTADIDGWFDEVADLLTVMPPAAAEAVGAR